MCVFVLRVCVLLGSGLKRTHVSIEIQKRATFSIINENDVVAAKIPIGIAIRPNLG